MVISGILREATLEAEERTTQAEAAVSGFTQYLDRKPAVELTTVAAVLNLP